MSWQKLRDAWLNHFTNVQQEYDSAQSELRKQLTLSKTRFDALLKDISGLSNSAFKNIKDAQSQTDILERTRKEYGSWLSIIPLRSPAASGTIQDVYNAYEELQTTLGDPDSRLIDIALPDNLFELFQELESMFTELNSKPVADEPIQGDDDQIRQAMTDALQKQNDLHVATKMWVGLNLLKATLIHLTAVELLDSIDLDEVTDKISDKRKLNNEQRDIIQNLTIEIKLLGHLYVDAVKSANSQVSFERDGYDSVMTELGKIQKSFDKQWQVYITEQNKDHNAGFPRRDGNAKEFVQQMSDMDEFMEMTNNFQARYAEMEQSSQGEVLNKCEANKGRLMLHQAIRGVFLQPKFHSVRGLLDASVPGTGKSRSIGSAIMMWFLHSGESTNTNRHGLVLVPRDKLINNFLNELRQIFPQPFFNIAKEDVTNSSGTSVNSLILTITQVQLGFTEFGLDTQKRIESRPFTVVVHNFTSTFPQKIVTKYSRLQAGAVRYPRKQESYTTNKHPVYSFIEGTASEQNRILQTLEADRKAYESIITTTQANKVAIVAKSLVVIDEVQDLFDPRFAIARYDQSLTTMAWVRELQQRNDIKILATSATPAYDTLHGMNLVRVLSLMKNRDDKFSVDQGILRRALKSDELTGRSQIEKAYTAACIAEQEYLKSQFMTEPKAVGIDKFHDLFMGVVALAAIEKDRGLFAHINTKGLEIPNPVAEDDERPYFVRDQATNSYQFQKEGMMGDDDNMLNGWKWFFGPGDKKGKNLLAPIRIEGNNSMPEEDMDLEESDGDSDVGSWRKIKSVEVLVPMSESRYKRYETAVKKDAINHPSKDKSCTYCLDYTSKALDTELRKNWWLGLEDEIPMKLQLLQQFLEDYFPNTKHAAFSNLRQFQYYRKAIQQWAQKAKIKYIGFAEFVDWIVTSIPQMRLGNGVENYDEAQISAELIRHWIATRKNESRMLFYIGRSASVLDTQKAISKLQRTRINMGEKGVSNCLFQIWNHPQNSHGELCQLLIGDSGNRVGISLLDTPFLHLLDPSLNLSDFKQMSERNNRMCGMQEYSKNPMDWKRHVISYISTLPIQKKNPNGRVKSSVPAIQYTNEEYQFERVLNKDEDGDPDVLSFMMDLLPQMSIDRLLIGTDTSRIHEEDDQPFAVNPIPGNFGMCVTTDQAGVSNKVDLQGFEILYNKVTERFANLNIISKDAPVSMKKLHKACSAAKGIWKTTRKATQTQALMLYMLMHTTDEIMQARIQKLREVGALISDVEETPFILHSKSFPYSQNNNVAPVRSNSWNLSKNTPSKKLLDSLDGLLAQQAQQPNKKMQIQDTNVVLIEPNQNISTQLEWELFQVLIQILSGEEIGIKTMISTLDILDASQRTTLTQFLTNHLSVRTKAQVTAADAMVKQTISIFDETLKAAEHEVKLHRLYEHRLDIDRMKVDAKNRSVQRN